MANTTPNEKASRPGSWTDEDKMKLLFQIVFQLPKIDWKQVVPPSGRDLRSCQNMIDVEKRRLGISRGAAGKAKGKGDGDESPEKGAEKSTGKTNDKANDKAAAKGAGDTPQAETTYEIGDPSTPTPAKKKPATPRKRKSVSTPVAGGDDNGNDNDNDAGLSITLAAEEKPKKKRTPAKPKAKKGAAAEASPALKAESEGHELPEVKTAKIKEFGASDSTEPMTGLQTAMDNEVAKPASEDDGPAEA